MSVSFSKINNLSLKEEVIRQLENKILSGDLQPGDRLPPERELAAALGVSRSLVNLSILELESKGFVSIVPRQGTFVNNYRKQGTPQILLALMNYDFDRMDWKLFDNLMDTRRLLEYESTRLAVKYATDEDLKNMEDALKTMEQHDNMESFIEGNFNFHHSLTSASGNAVYAMIYKSFEHALHFFLKHYFSSDERRDISIKQHRELLNTIIKRDEDKALEALKRTLDMGIEVLARIFKQ